MLKIIPVNLTKHRSDVRELFWENLSTTESEISREFGIRVNLDDMLERNLAILQQFTPPTGCLLLAEYENKFVGCAGLRKIGETVGEVKRMYVKLEYRCLGIGRALLQAIIEQARTYEYSKLWLDSAPFAKAAQALYYSVGFQKIDPYPESEIPIEYHPRWVFMELIIGNG